MAATYNFQVDWNNDGDWGDTGENVTARVLARTPLAIQFGRDQNRALSPVAPGTASFELNNRSRDYTPDNGSSPLFGNLKPGRTSRIGAVLNSNPYFETDAANWTGNNGTFVRSTAQAHQGTASGLLTPTGGIAQSYAETEHVPVAGGSTLTASAWLRSGPGYASVSLSVNWFDSAHAYLSTSSNISSLAAATWTLREHTYTAPSTAAFASLVPTESGTPPATATLHVDEATLGVVLYQGLIDGYDVQPGREERSVALSFVDVMAKFQEVKLSTALYQGIRTGQAVDLILDAIGWPGGTRDLDTGGTLLPWWWEEGSDAVEALQKVLASEGSPALFYVDYATGNAVFRDRHHRLIRAASTSSQATFRDTGAEPKFSAPVGYDAGFRDVVNSVSFSVEERVPDGALSAVWETDEILTLMASEARVIVLQTSEPFQGAVAPVAGTDFTVLAGGVSSVTISRTSGAASSITVTATGAGATIQGMALRAYSVPVARTYQITKTDSASITDHGVRSMPSDWEPVWASKGDAQGIADLTIIQRAQRLPILTITVMGAANATRLTQCLTRVLSDRVTVVDAETGLNTAFYVENIRHEVSEAGRFHTTVFGLEKVPTQASSTFIVGTSLLNGASTLAY
jgi:hypothetical protein